MTAAPRISVIIPCYNAAATIGACVASVLAVDYQDFEVIVVDDRSTDDSRQIVDALAQADGKVRLLAQERNGGPAKARNRGAREATGEILFFLDSDTQMLPDALANTARRIAEADVVVGVYAAQSLNPASCAKYKALLNNYFFSRGGVIPYEVFDSSRAAIKASVFHAEGGFNESLAWGMDYENEEFGYRLHGRHVMLLDPSIEVQHHFPGFGKMTRDYFFRVALWMEIFLRRRKFESGGVTTGGTGLSSAALLGVLASLPLLPLLPSLDWLTVLLGGTYIAGYAPFFRFVLRREPGFLPTVVAHNVFFTLVIACGAAWGVVRAVRRKP